MKILALVVIMVSCFFDPIQQVLLAGRYDGTVGWWPFHLTHWAAFYPPLIYIAVREIYLILWNPLTLKQVGRCGIRYIVKHMWWRLALVAVVAWITWQLGLIAAGSPWESVWIVWLKGLFA